ncbi:MAG TPA: prepilin-type N-terminal cleavage/methylation domain-containing protein [Terriglobia bacterium]|nr:prepilin-type N-terminal cleavage/methylation domain-containing protein [Terriglobia bacterium]
MKKNPTTAFRISGRGNEPAGPQQGFSLLELVVAMAVFSIVSAAAFSLFNQQQTVFVQQQGQVGLNIGLRNALTMMQMDVANAGSGLQAGANVPSWPVGVTFSVPPSGTCYNATNPPTYSASCFDSMNIITASTSAQAVNATNSTGNNGPAYCSDTSTGTAYAQKASSLTLAQTAAQFSNGDELLFVNSNGHKMTAVILNAAGTVAGTAVRLTFGATTAAGVNSSDPLKIATVALTSSVVNDVWTDTTAFSDQLASQFCGPDWIIKLAPINYKVDTTTASNPKLTRSQSGSTSVVMEQVVGFKVGTAIWNDGSGGVDSTYAPYYYDPSLFPVPNDFSLVRSVRISLLARTAPTTNPTYKFRNAFDNGAYQIQGSAVVVNPRNLSMDD